MPTIIEFEKIEDTANKTITDIRTVIPHLASRLKTDTTTIKLSSVVTVGTSQHVYQFSLKFRDDVIIVNNSSCHAFSCAAIRMELHSRGFFFTLKSMTTRPPEPADHPPISRQQIRPAQSANSRALEHIAELDIPEKYCCKISSDIMDDPVRDVRFLEQEDQVYDRANINHAICSNKDDRLPHTQMSYTPGCLKTDHKLKLDINAFVEKEIEQYNQRRLKQLYKKYKVDAADVSLESNNLLLRRISANNGYEDANWLLAQGDLVNINAKDQKKTGYTPLHLALHRDHMYLALLLISYRASITEMDKDGCTPLMWASQQPQHLAAQFLLHCIHYNAISKHDDDFKRCPRELQEVVIKAIEDPVLTR